MNELYRFCTENYFKWLSWSPDGSTLAASCNNNVLVFGYKLQQKFILKMPRSVSDLVFYPFEVQDGQFLIAVSSLSIPVKLFRTSDSTEYCSFKNFENEKVKAPSCLEFSSDGGVLFTGFKDYMVLYDVGQQREMQRLKEQRGVYSCIKYNQQRQMFGCSSYGNNFAIYKDNNVLTTQVESPSNFCFDESGNLCFLSQRNGLVTCLDLRTLKPLYTYNRIYKTNQKTSVCCHENKVIISGCKNGSVVCVDFDLKNETVMFKHDDTVSCCFPNQVFASCSGQRFPDLVDNSLRIWEY